MSVARPLARRPFQGERAAGHASFAERVFHSHVHVVMERAGQTQTDIAWGCEPLVDDGEHRRLLWLMAEFFRTLGYTDIKARLPGFSSPPVLSGTLEDHRPDFTCRQTDAGRTPLIVEIVTPERVADPGMDNRWSLLGSAAKLYNAELHFVVPKWSPLGTVDDTLKRRLARMELVPNRVWTV